MRSSSALKIVVAVIASLLAVACAGAAATPPPAANPTSAGASSASPGVAATGTAVASSQAASPSPSQAAGAPADEYPSAATSGAGAAAGPNVRIVDFAFQPAALSVKAGTKVTWQNAGDASHTATSDNGAFDTDRIDEGASASFTFTTAGSFPYHCDFHPNMKGTITVTP